MAFNGGFFSKAPLISGGRRWNFPPVLKPWHWRRRWVFHRFSQQMEVIEPGFTSLELCWFNGISPTANGDFSCWFNDFPMENLAVIRRSTWKTTVFVDGWVILQPCLIPPPGCHFFFGFGVFFSNFLGSTPGIWGYNYDWWSGYGYWLINILMIDIIWG